MSKEIELTEPCIISAQFEIQRLESEIQQLKDENDQQEILIGKLIDMACSEGAGPKMRNLIDSYLNSKQENSDAD